MLCVEWMAKRLDITRRKCSCNWIDYYMRLKIFAREYDEISGLDNYENKGDDYDDVNDVDGVVKMGKGVKMGKKGRNQIVRAGMDESW